jgi:hypothetical protein
MTMQIPRPWCRNSSLLSVLVIGACANPRAPDVGSRGVSYSQVTRTPAAPPNDPLVINACNLGNVPVVTLNFGGTCQTSQKVCATNSDCIGETPTTCVIGELPVPNSVVAAFQAAGFEFAGSPIPGIWVGQDGYLVFTDSRPNSTTAQVGLPTTLDQVSAPAPAVMAFWDDLRSSSIENQGPYGGPVCVALASDNTLWVTWNACFAVSGCALADDLVFTIGLESATNIVSVGYIAMTSPVDAPDALGNSAVVGIREAVAPGCTPDQCNAATGMCDDGTTPCGYNQAFAKTVHTTPLPMTNFVFSPSATK